VQNRGGLDRLRRLLEPFVHAVGRGDEARIVELLGELSARHRSLAPFTFAFGGVAMLLAGVRVLFENWRLTLVQVLPAMWVWLAMYDLRLHLLKENTMSGVRGAILVPIGLAIVAGTIASYFLNTVFAFAVAQDGRPDVRLAFGEARGRMGAIVAWGVAVGFALAIATTVVPRAGAPWFALCLGIVVGVLMVTYVAVPARLIGVSKRRASPRDRLAAAAFGTLIGVVVSAPPYLIGRIGILMLGSPVLFVPGLALLAIGAIMQAGATGAVKAVKVSSRLS
jgi:putative flippase GtrA